jgi:hypothetical protein
MHKHTLTTGRVFFTTSLFLKTREKAKHTNANAMPRHIKKVYIANNGMGMYKMFLSWGMVPAT